MGREEDFWNLSQRHLGPYPGSVGMKAKNSGMLTERLFSRNSLQEQTQVGSRYFKILSLQNSGS